MSGDSGFSTGDLLPSLSKFERLLEEEADPLTRLADLAGPSNLGYLFEVRLATLLRRGPGAGPASPRHFFMLAQRASRAGLLPADTAGVLRRTLQKAASLLREAGAWSDEPLWWGELPDPEPFEELWDGFGDSDGALAPAEELAAAIRESPGSPLWLPLPAFLSPATTRSIWQELEFAHDDDRLELEEGAVGEGRLSVRRSDWVRYVTGLEPWLAHAAPTLAAFVQWGLRHLAPRLAAGGRRVYPPQAAMLARYPAPSAGYAAHMDNPGGEHDNGRTLTLVLYLNAPGKECVGGEIALWAQGDSTAGPPTEVLAPRSGSGVLFDSREIAHQVHELAEGPARWALTFWFNDEPQQAEPLMPRPRLGLTELLLQVASPPLPAGNVLFHELDEKKPGGEVLVRTAGPERPRTGIVCTAYREGTRLDSWCEHHLALGADHLVLVFDRLEEDGEQAVADRLRKRFSDRLTIWSGSATARRWGTLPTDPRLDTVRRYAELGSAASYAIASRQALNASVALEAARTDELGGAPLDWLLHLDADELFYLEGHGRGGSTLAEHFSAASRSGYGLMRYANHEALLRSGDDPPRFKINPYLAAARLGPGGWRSLVNHLKMAQTDPRPYFTGYFNGKSAVAVPAGAAAAGVHGWFLREPQGEWARGFLAGPSVAHFHFSTPESFSRKYLAIAASPVPPGGQLFELSPSEETTVGLIRRLEREGAEPQAVRQHLEELHETMTSFSAKDVEFLDESGLLVRPSILLP